MDFAKMIVTGLLYIMGICMLAMATMARLPHCSAFFPIVFIIFLVSFLLIFVIILITDN